MIFNKKSILKSRPNSVDEEKNQDRQHMIRFTGNEANDIIYHLANNKVGLLLIRNLIFFLNSTIPCIVFIIISNTIIELQGLIKIF
jgi:hypothetical protein